MKTPTNGRASIFRGKDKSKPVQGVLTKIGRVAFERGRKQLSALVQETTGRQIKRVSDGDTVEFLSRGVAETRHYLETLKS